MTAAIRTGSREPGTDGTDEPLLDVQDITVAFRTGAGVTTPVVQGVSLKLQPGESVALVGESGSGKTTLILAILRLLPKLARVQSGSVHYKDRTGANIDVLALSRRQLKAFRWEDASIVYQGAMNSLNPLTKVRAQFIETARAHNSWSTAEIITKSEHLLELVRLDPKRVLRSYPHELSGGMRQRVLIALGLLLDPQLVILDEPTTALDVLTQRSVVDMLRDLNDQMSFASIFVSHDLALAAELADRVAIMYAGRLIENGAIEETFYRPFHPYTRGLLDAILTMNGGVDDVRAIPGQPPGFGALPAGCAFHGRCPYAQAVCATQIPETTVDQNGHLVACHRANDLDLTRAEVGNA